jgi:recombination protein RecA
VNEERRQRTIREKLARMATVPAADAIATGFAALDAALGVGGLPRGAIVELFGPAACGKSTLALQIAARIQREGRNVAWLDAEHTFDATYAAPLGIDIARCAVLQPDSAEEALEMARRLAGSHAVDLLVIDSAAALVPRMELVTGIGEAGPGLQARVLASGLRRLSATAGRSHTCVLFLNQTRMQREPSGEEGETSAGGAPLKLYAAARIALYPVTDCGVRFRVLKNRASGAFREGKLAWKPGTGFAESP